MSKFDNFIFSSHMVGNIICAPKPISAKQFEKLKILRSRQRGEGKPLTDKMTEDWHSLEHKYAESKKYKLTDGQKTLLSNIAYQYKYKRKTSINSKYFTKGLAMEKESRDIISRLLGLFLTEDDERRTNNWVTGKRDIKHEDVIIDIKTTFTLETFYRHLIESSSGIYLDQLDCYMELWDTPHSILAYVLTDTPEALVQSELRTASYNHQIFNVDGSVKDEEMVKKIVNNLIFTRKGIEEFCQSHENIHIELFDDFVEIPESDRVHMIEHKFDKKRIEQRNKSISLSREFMNTVSTTNHIINV